MHVFHSIMHMLPIIKTYFQKEQQEKWSLALIKSGFGDEVESSSGKKN